ncbi:DNA-directed RNA polymerase subunit beta' [Miltoncostaea marina]|uniref:DNA-directed RNA polymerase subunit beta' n=1 Tax=Miltoncostaea marina TaxID=2843215 RepID=UPI001FE93916|nr:DNA-directed RNA polymerase subunit beta' [Miltoncostaea marina]
MIDINNFDSITIGLASSKQIRQWSSGEVTKPETINYRTLKPEKDGLFCEKIFGPTKDWECYCGKYKRVRYKGIICERCGVEVTRAKVRRERMGHIDLAAPVSHIWFFKGVPSRIGYMLDIAPKELEKVLYFAASIVTEVDTEARGQELDRLQDEVNAAIEQFSQDKEERLLELDERLDRRVQWLREADADVLTDEDEYWAEDLQRDRSSDDPEARRELTDADRKQAESDLRKETDVTKKDIERYTEEAIERLTQAWLTFKDVKRGDIISDEQLFREMKDRFGSPHGFAQLFSGGMGAAAIKELLDDLAERSPNAGDDDPRRTKLQDLADELRETIKTSKGQRQARALKRLKVVSAFIRSQNSPGWMILDAIPVIPPELRPMVQLDGGRFATSDLNDLYRRVINRNNRLKRLLDLGAPEIIVNNEKRMLQEAVDALFDNGRRGRAVTGPGNRPLKSLSDMLKGKQGRFRQNLLGKRVDYSGRSVIVAGPELKLHQCGLPKLMALELFKPFIMSRLVERKQVQNIKAAKKLVDAMVPEVWDVLEEVIGEHPVLLNRAPTLHRLGIQAFEPVLVEGKAIQIHPLVCTAFNADFDGDQMAVHLPLSVEAQAEARILMLSANNILSPAHGRPIAVPSQDMILGLYYLTYAPVVSVRKKGDEGEGRDQEVTELWNHEARAWELPKGMEAKFDGGEWTTKPFAGMSEPRPFGSEEDVFAALDQRAVGLQDLILMRYADGTRRVTTPGRVVFNHEVRTALEAVVGAEELAAQPFPDRHESLTKRHTGDFIEELVNLYGATAVSMVLDAFKALGFRYATDSGLTVSKNDIVVPPTKGDILAKYDAKVEEVEEFFALGEMSPEERHEEVVKLWEQATDEVAEAMQEHLWRLNPIYMMANSGARGSFKQIRQLAGMRGCMNNPKGETIERPIKSNFMEGLSVLEYFISTHGARKGLADTALKTADSGYLTRRLVDVSQDVIVRELDCGTDEGIEVPVFRDDNALNPSVPGRVLLGPVVDRRTGEVLLDLRPEADSDDPEDVAAATRGHLVTTVEGERLNAELREADGTPRDAVVLVRSPVKCRSEVGICARCYGRNPASGRLTEPGDAVGIIAAQSIGEPGTQLTMRTFHTGGVAGADITHGLPRVVELFEARKPKAQAVVSPVDGWVRITDDETRPGSATLTVVEPEYVEMDDAGTGATKAPVREHSFTALRRTQITVDDGQWVEAGDLLTTGSAFPADILSSKPGVAIGVQGRITGVTEDGEQWLRVDVETEAGTSQRWLRLPADRPRPVIEAGTQVRTGQRFYAQDGVRDRSTKTELYLVSEVQNVYRSQGVDINDKHIELIVRQMLRKVRVEDPGGTHFLPGQMVDKPVLYRENARAAQRIEEQLLEKRESGEFTGDDSEIARARDGVQAVVEPLILGITKASLATESFLSAASFQETTKVLTDAALEGKTDRLRGLKENVIIGKLIPAATGLKRYRQLEIEAVRRAPALLEFDLDEPFSEADDDALLGIGDGDGQTYSFGPELEGEES